MDGATGRSKARKLLSAKYRMQDEQIGGDYFGPYEEKWTISAGAALEILTIKQDRRMNPRNQRRGTLSASGLLDREIVRGVVG